MGDSFIAETMVTRWGRDESNRTLGLRANANTNSKMFVMAFHDNFISNDEIYLVYRSVNGGSTTADSGTLIDFPGDGYVASFIRTGNQVFGYYDGEYLGSRTISNWNLDQVALTDTDGTGNSSEFDWVRVRRFTLDPPGVTPGTGDTANGLCPTCYDKAITVDNSGRGAQTGYQIRIEIDETHLNFWSHVTEDGDDIRFYDSDGVTELSYWIEEFKKPPASDDYVRISAFAEAHTCAVLSTGEAVCWGRNDYGQVGDTTNDDRHLPEEVAHSAGAAAFGNADLESGAIAVGTGYNQSFAVHENGVISSWGYSGSGQRGIGTNTQAATPAQVCPFVQN
jgi:hypothetical protein